MKDSNKIKKIDIGFDNSYSKILFDDKEYWKLAELLIDKTNELIDKVNELSDKLESQPEEPKKHKSYTDLDYAEEEINNIEREYRLGLIDIYQYRDGLSTARKKYLEEYKQPEKQVIYTSEGDAVGEVEKKCVHLLEFANTGSLGTCVKCKIKSYYGYEPKD